MDRHILTRREFIRLSALTATGLAITACYPSTGSAPNSQNKTPVSSPSDAIPKDVAWRLCAEVREENRGKWYTFNGLWCLGCENFSQGDPAKMCVSSSPDYRGCAQVNARYDRQARSRGA